MSAAGPLRVEVRFFAALAERAGCAHETVEVEPAADVQALWRRLSELHPGLDDLGYRPLVACDMAWSNWERSLAGVREVAFVPPVSGG